MAIIVCFMEDSRKNLEGAINLINSAKRVLLVSHVRPDGDTLGAASALSSALEQMGKTVTLACADDIPHRLKFIPRSELFVKEFNMDDFDLIIALDAGAHHMTGFHSKYPDFLLKRIPILNIDHHASNDGFGTVNIVDPKASSVTLIIWRLLPKLPVAVTKEIAFSLLVGIYSDTGGFMHANTTDEAFAAANELAKTGGFAISEITRPLFRQSTFSQLRLWGYVLENLRKNENNVLSCVVSEADFKDIGAHQSDTGGIIDLINTVPDTLYSMLLAEDNGCVKGSLRTQRDDVNLSDIASQFGGGGHPKAAGFRVHGRLEKKVIWKIVPADRPAHPA